MIIMESCTVTIILLSERSQRVQKGEGGGVGGGAGSLSNAHYQSHHKTADQRMIFFFKDYEIYMALCITIYTQKMLYSGIRCTDCMSGESVSYTLRIFLCV